MIFSKYKEREILYHSHTRRSIWQIPKWNMHLRHVRYVVINNQMPIYAYAAKNSRSANRKWSNLKEPQKCFGSEKVLQVMDLFRKCKQNGSLHVLMKADQWHKHANEICKDSLKAGPFGRHQFWGSLVICAQNFKTCQHKQWISQTYSSR